MALRARYGLSGAMLYRTHTLSAVMDEAGVFVVARNVSHERVRAGKRILVLVALEIDLLAHLLAAVTIQLGLSDKVCR